MVLVVRGRWLVPYHAAALPECSVTAVTRQGEYVTGSSAVGSSGQPSDRSPARLVPGAVSFGSVAVGSYGHALGSAAVRHRPGKPHPGCVPAWAAPGKTLTHWGAAAAIGFCLRLGQGWASSDRPPL